MQGGYADSGREWSGTPGDYRRGEGRGQETWRSDRDYDRSGGSWSGGERYGHSGRGGPGGERGYGPGRTEGDRWDGFWSDEGRSGRSGRRDRWESGAQEPFSGRERWRSRYGAARPYEGEPMSERKHGRSLHYDPSRSRQDEQHQEDIGDRLRDAWHRFTSEIGGLFERSRGDYDRDYRDR
jgi:hypothetical protein